MRKMVDVALVCSAAFLLSTSAGYYLNVMSLLRLCCPVGSTLPTAADWTEALAAVVTAVTSVILLVSLIFAAQRLRLTREWNKMNATFTYFQTPAYLQHEKSAIDALHAIGINLQVASDKLSDAELDKLWRSREAFGATRDFLNYLEDFSVAVLCEALHEPTAKRMMCDLVTRYAVVFAPFFERRRDELRRKDVHTELQALGKRWMPATAKAAISEP